VLALARSVIRSNIRFTLIAAVGGLAALAVLMLMPARNRAFSLGMILVMALLCSPFTLRIVVGRTWWLTSALSVLSGIGAVCLGIHSVLGWLLGIVAAGFNYLGVCLRWEVSATLNRWKAVAVTVVVVT
jgi:hypothetical protein